MVPGTDVGLDVLIRMDGYLGHHPWAPWPFGISTMNRFVPGRNKWSFYRHRIGDAVDADV